MALHDVLFGLSFIAGPLLGYLTGLKMSSTYTRRFRQLCVLLFQNSTMRITWRVRSFVSRLEVHQPYVVLLEYHAREPAKRSSLWALNYVPHQNLT
jgi:hypothetical protein